MNYLLFMLFFSAFVICLFLQLLLTFNFIIRSLIKGKNTVRLIEIIDLIDKKEKKIVNFIYHNRNQRVKKGLVELENTCTLNVYNDFNWCLENVRDDKTYSIIILLNDESTSDFTIIGKKEYLFLAREIGLSEICFYYDYNLSEEKSKFIFRYWLQHNKNISQPINKISGNFGD